MNPRTLNAVFSKLHKEEEKKQEVLLETHKVEFNLIKQIESDADLLFDLMEKQGVRTMKNDLKASASKLKQFVKSAKITQAQMRDVAKSLEKNINAVQSKLKDLGLDNSAIRDEMETLDQYKSLDSKAIRNLVDNAESILRELMS